MNNKHYERVKLVLDKVDKALPLVIPILGKELVLDGRGEWIPGWINNDTVDPGAIGSNLLEFGREIWEEQFPSESGPPSEILDLSDCKLNSRVFICNEYPGWPLDRANLRQANLDRTRWVGVSIRNADLTGASLRWCYTFQLRCSGALFRDANLTGAKLSLITDNLDKPADFSNANLSEAKIIIHGKKAAVIFKGAEVEGKPCIVSVPAGYRDKVLKSLSEEDRKKFTVLERQAEGKCFIAAAVCGSIQPEQVSRLRGYRETVLKHSELGRAFICIYEIISPPVARIIIQSPWRRKIARLLVVQPAYWLAKHDLRRRWNRLK